MTDYYLKKRERILQEIKPICAAFGIEDYDYIVYCKTGNLEILKLGNTFIGCTGNSVSAVVDELIGYIFITKYCRNRSLGAFDKQTKNHIMRYWLKESELNTERVGDG